MAIITTYVCDVSGKQGVAEDFVEVKITPTKVSYKSDFHPCTAFTKVVHKEVALKLGFILAKKDEVIPEVTLESKLTALMKEWVQELAYEAGAEGGAEAVSNYNR